MGIHKYKLLDINYTKMTSIITWKPHKNDNNTNVNLETTNQPKINLVSYNILADAHLQANKWLYKHCDSQHLNNSNRFNLIFKALTDSKPDILFLQEVQETHLEEIRKFLASQMNHNCYFSKRPNGKPDGCLVSYNTERFMPVDVMKNAATQNNASQNIEFVSSPISKLDFSKNCPLPGTSDNTALVLVLQDFDVPEKFLILANTHLVYSPNRGHIKLWQITRLVYEILKVKRILRKDYGVIESDISIVLGGDLNSKINSPLCNYLTGADVDMSNVSLKQFSAQKFDKNPKSIMSVVEESNGNGGNSGNSGNCHHNNILKLPFQNKNSPNIIEAKIKFEQVYKIEENAEKYSTIGRKFYDHLFCENIDVFNELEIPFSKDNGE